MRQGDVFGPVPYPKFKSAPQKIEKPQGWGADPLVRMALEFPADARYATIVSHDCEFNADKRQHFLVARLSAFPPTLSDEEKAAIKAANDAITIVEPEPGERFDYIDTFVLDPLEGHFEEEMMVNFTTIMPLSMSMTDVVENLKEAELVHEDRVRLRKKLGFFIGREGDDVPDEEKQDPPERVSGS